MDVRAPLRAVEPQRDRHQRGTGLHRKRRRTAHHVRLLAEEVDLDAATGDVPVRGQADQPARAQPLGENPEPLHTAGRGEHLEPEPFPEGEEPPGQRLGLEPLGHGGELGHATGDDPRSGLVPVAHVRQREHRTATGGERGEQPVLPLACISVISRSGLITGSRNTSNQYLAYECMPARDSARSSLPDGSGPTTRRRFASSNWTPGPCRRQAISPACWNTHRPHDSGTRQTSHQAAAYDAAVTRPFSADTTLLITALRYSRWCSSVHDGAPARASSGGSPPSSRHESPAGTGAAGRPAAARRTASTR